MCAAFALKCFKWAANNTWLLRKWEAQPKTKYNSAWLRIRNVYFRLLRLRPDPVKRTNRQNIPQYDQIRLSTLYSILQRKSYVFFVFFFFFAFEHFLKSTSLDEKFSLRIILLLTANCSTLYVQKYFPNKHLSTPKVLYFYK